MNITMDDTTMSEAILLFFIFLFILLYSGCTAIAMIIELKIAIMNGEIIL